MPIPPPEKTVTLSNEAMYDVQQHQTLKKSNYLCPPPIPFDLPLFHDGNVHEYALAPSGSLDDMYEFVYNYMRFGGPRLIGPFRELHLLSDPMSNDTSDFAEDIRWAKQQFADFGNIWMETPEHLHAIAAHRLSIGWQSDEAFIADALMTPTL